MKTIITSLFLALSVVAFGQFPRNTGHLPIKHDTIIQGSPELNVLSIPAYPAVDSNATFIAPGQVFKTVITNNSSHSVSLYPYLNRVGMEQIAWGDSFLLAYLHSQIVGLSDTDEIRLKLVQTIATKIEKTDLFSHGQIIYNEFSDSILYKKQTSPMGAIVGTYQKQCGNFIASGIAILMETGYFKIEDFHFIALVGHVTGEFAYRGGWAFFDLDPEEPFFMIRNDANTNGFASALDIKNNPGLITDNQRYYFINDTGDSVNLCPTQTTEQYQAKFDSVLTTNVPFSNGTLDLSGTIVLPAKASVIAEYTTPYILDSASFILLSNAYATGNNNTFYSTLSQLVNISIDSARIIVSEHKIALNCTTKTFQPSYTALTPTVKIIIPASADTVKLETDLGFPGYVLGSNTDLYFSDTIFRAGQSPYLWSPNKNASAPAVSDGEVHYLAESGILPAHINIDTLAVSYNPKIINFAAGFQLGYVGDSIFASVFLNDSVISADSSSANLHPRINPLIYTHTTSNQPIIRTEHNHNHTSGIKSVDYNYSVYPNPASNSFRISSNQDLTDKVALFNLEGKLLLIKTLSETDNSVDVSGLNNGEYIYIIGEITGKIIILH